MEKPLVSIIILNWNKRELLRRCLSSIKRNVEYPNFEVIVVDNNSSDGSVEMVKRFFPDVRLVENPTNYGFCRGNNEGIRVSKGIPFILNNDTVIQRGSLRRMVQVLTSDEEVGIVGGTLVTPDGKVQTPGYFFPKSCLLSAVFPSLYKRKMSQTFATFGSRREVCWVSGAALMIKREVINDVGMFDERYFAFCDEVDLCYRVKRAGYKVVWVADAKIIHVHGATAPLDSKWRRDLNERNTLLFKIKNYPPTETAKELFLHLIDIFRMITLSLVRRDRQYLQAAQSKIKACSYIKSEAERPPIPRHKTDMHATFQNIYLNTKGKGC